MSGGLKRINQMTSDEAAAVLHAICGSGRWVEAMLASRPFIDAAGLFAAAEREWLALSREDCLEAFSHHPKIGERNLTQARFAATAQQSSRDQSGMAAASEAERAEFAARNAEYERKFGHVFLICATGKSASEMLTSLRSRLGNDAQTELRNAVGEQAKIIRLRLERWLAT